MYIDLVKFNCVVLNYYQSERDLFLMISMALPSI